VISKKEDLQFTMMIFEEFGEHVYRLDPPESVRMARIDADREFRETLAELLRDADGDSDIP
jgi:hypothetical protein